MFYFVLTCIYSLEMLLWKVENEANLFKVRYFPANNGKFIEIRRIKVKNNVFA